MKATALKELLALAKKTHEYFTFNLVDNSHISDYEVIGNSAYNNLENIVVKKTNFSMFGNLLKCEQTTIEYELPRSYVEAHQIKSKHRAGTGVGDLYELELDEAAISSYKRGDFVNGSAFIPLDQIKSANITPNVYGMLRQIRCHNTYFKFK